MRVLVVEDEPAVRPLVDRLLTPHGQHVITAPTVFEAMALLLDFPDPIDVALLDLLVFGMGGYVYADTIQRQFPGARVVFMTGAVEADRLSEAERRARVLLRPFTRDQLYNAVETRSCLINTGAA